MTSDRGKRLQHALARYLAEWWPSAESCPPGRRGSDVLGIPGVAWENKTANEWRPAKWVEQARCHARGDELPVVAYWPNGVGEKTPEAVMAILPLPDLVSLLIEAGYTGDRPRIIESLREALR